MQPPSFFQRIVYGVRRVLQNQEDTMVLKPQLWIVAVQYEDEQAGNYGRWSVHYGTAEEMSRVFERLLHEPMVHTAYKARVHETVSPQTKRVLKP